MTSTDDHDQGQRAGSDGRRVTFNLMPGGGGWRVSYGDGQRGQYVIVEDYQTIRPYVNGERPLRELVDRLGLRGAGR